jgi:proline iminopeptidase
VSELHTLYFEQCGNPRGKPVVFLHGGPGAGCNAKSRRFFDPARYRIILFDQRGCGRSTPHAELTDNTIWHLVDDIERLRVHLGLERWQVFGGSWGSTLALAYAEKHPERVTELVLRGIFMLRRSELEWFYQKGCDAIYPDAWEPYLAAIPAVERADLMGAYYRRLTSPDPAVRLAAAKAWSLWEGGTSFLQASADYIASTGGDIALAFARINATTPCTAVSSMPMTSCCDAAKLKNYPRSSCGAATTWSVAAARGSAPRLARSRPESSAMRGIRRSGRDNPRAILTDRFALG